jgi:hypothetical protein
VIPQCRYGAASALASASFGRGILGAEERRAPSSVVLRKRLIDLRGSSVSMWT